MEDTPATEDSEYTAMLLSASDGSVEASIEAGRERAEVGNSVGKAVLLNSCDGSIDFGDSSIKAVWE
jgi:hypothetical protein